MTYLLSHCAIAQITFKTGAKTQHFGTIELLWSVVPGIVLYWLAIKWSRLAGALKWNNTVNAFDTSNCFCVHCMLCRHHQRKSSLSMWFFLHKVFIQTLVMLPCIVFSIWTVLKRTILKLYITVVLWKITISASISLIQDTTQFRVAGEALDNPKLVARLIEKFTLIFTPEVSSEPHINQTETTVKSIHLQKASHKFRKQPFTLAV